MSTVEAPVETREESKDEQFDRLLDEKLGDENVSTEEVPVGDPPVEEEIVEPETAEGPSTVMATVARQSGVPPQLVALARDDKQLQEMIELVDNREAPGGPAAEEEFAIDLPEDEYGQDDSVRKQFDRLNQHYSGIVSKLREELASVAHAVSSVDTQQKDLTQQQAEERQKQFDTVVDGYETFGKFGELSQAQGKVRGAIYDEYLELRRANPHHDPASLVEHALKKVIPGAVSNKTAKQQRESVQAQSRRKLGTGNASPPAVDPSKDDKADEFFANLRQKRGIKL